MTRLATNPLVYGSLEALINDLNFKSFLDVEFGKFFNSKGDLVKNFVELRRSEKRAFLIDNDTYEKFEMGSAEGGDNEFIEQRVREIEDHKVELVSIIDEFAKRKTLELDLKKIRLKQDFFEREGLSSANSSSKEDPKEIMRLKLNYMQELP